MINFNMKQIIPFLFTLVLFASCSQQRYAHRAKVKMKPNQTDEVVLLRPKSIITEQQVAIANEVASQEADRIEMAELARQQEVLSELTQSAEQSVKTSKALVSTTKLVKELKGSVVPSLKLPIGNATALSKSIIPVLAPKNAKKDLPKGENWFKLVVLGLILILFAIIIRFLFLTLGNIIGAIGAFLIILGILLFLYEMM